DGSFVSPDGGGISGFDAEVYDAARHADSATFPTDAACVGDALAGETGSPFVCAGSACWSGSSFCGIFSAGRNRMTLGCNPLPVACAPVAGCECLEPLPDNCVCEVDSGIMQVFCQLP